MYRKLLVVLVVATGVGRETRADKGYDFEQKPVQALQTIARLKEFSTGRQALSADELALMADVQKGQLQKLSCAEAALIASGMTDGEKRKAYLDRLDKIEAGAREAVAGAATAAEKGDKLLQYLHAGTMKPGYEQNQSSVAGILDSGKYNCVSSAVMYNVIGRRLGLDLRGMVKPGHAFSILYDGGRSYDVQTTCARGFDPKDPQLQKELEQKTGIKPQADHTSCRETGEVGLLSVICSNRTADFAKDQRYYEALLLGFLALGLDPSSETALDNTYAAWTQWTKHLIDKGEFENVMAVLAVGLQLAPKNCGLRCNREAAWARWIEAAQAQSEEAATALIRKLRKESGEDHDFQGVVRNHVNREMNKLVEKTKDYAGALAFIGRNREFLADAGKDMKPYVWQEWIAATYDRGGEEASRTLIRQLRKENGKDHDFQDVVRNHVIRTMNALVKDPKEAKDFRAALDLVERYREVLENEDEARTLTLPVYDAWAKPLMKPGKWDEAIRVYHGALALYPGDSHLTNNLRYCEQESKKQ